MDSVSTTDTESSNSSDNGIGVGQNGPFYCLNCKRKGIMQRPSDLAKSNEWFLRFVILTGTEIGTIHFRVKVCLFRNVYDSPQEQILLCWQCRRALTLNAEERKNYDYTWPAFMWSLLGNMRIRKALKLELWTLFPFRWRPWWIDKASLFPELRTITLINPVPYIEDITSKLAKAKTVMRDLKIKELTKLLDEQCFYPNVKCPWGCSVFLQELKGNIPFDRVLYKLLGVKCGAVSEITLSPASENVCIGGTRSDFLTACHYTLCNKAWRVMPAVTFIPKKGPRFVTCGFHSTASTTRYIHPPTNPFGSMSSEASDQFSQAVICPRTLKFAQKRHYSNSFQMNSIQGKYDGVDSATLAFHGRFDKYDFVSMHYDALVLAGRPDVSNHLNYLVSEMVIPPEYRESKLVISNEQYQNEAPEVRHKKNLLGSTYVTLQDAIELDIHWKKEQPLLLSIEDDTGARKTIYFTPSWPSTLIHVHPTLCHYGGHFPIISHNNDSKSPGSRMMWITSTMLVHVTTIWRHVCKTIHDSKQWHGWMLHHISKKHLKEYKCKPSRNSPFRKRITPSNLQSLLFGSIPTNFNPNFVQILFSHTPGIACLPTHDLRNWNVHHASDDVDVILVYNDLNANQPLLHQLDPTNLVPNTIPRTEAQSWKCVYVVETWLKTTDKWDGNVWSRHASEMHSGWWLQEKPKATWIRSKIENKPNPGTWDVSVYVRQKRNIADLRTTYFDLIGGQIICKCSRHLTYLIRDPVAGEKTCSVVQCVKAAMFSCSFSQCTSAICEDHMDELISNGDRHCTVDPLPHLQELLNSTNEESDEGDGESESHASTVVSATSDSIEEKFDNDEDDVQLFDPDDFDSDHLQELSASVEAFLSTSEMSSDENSSGQQGALRMTKKRKLPPLSTIDGSYITYGVYETDHVDDFEEELHSPEAALTTTNIGRRPLELSSPSHMIGLHVIFNKYQQLLTRYNGRLVATKKERNFVERIVSSSSNHSVPLVYPEGTLFPSIFWYMCQDGSIPGALPGALMTSNQKLKKAGFATLYDHMRTRVLNTQLLTSTDYRYQFYAMDACINLGIRGQDTRVILSRGFGEKMGASGILMNYDQSDNPMLNCDFIDTRPIVNKLAAAIGERMPTFFYTHTCSQSTHIGTRTFKRWIDSDESIVQCLRSFGKDYTTASFHDIAEAKRILTASSCLIAVRSWNLVSDAWMLYITKSTEYPIGKIDKSWRRKELQEWEANLHHIHSVLWHADDNGTAEGRIKILQLIRASIASLVLEDEFLSYKEEGIISSRQHLLQILEDLSKFLEHHHNRRCLIPRRNDRSPPMFVSRDLDDRQLSIMAKYQCKVPDNYILSTNPVRHTFVYLHVSHSIKAISILETIGLVVKVSGSLRLCDLEQHEELLYLDERLVAKRHIPPTAANEGIISPVLARLVIINPNSDNVQLLDSYGVSKYLAKYLTSVDKTARIFLRPPKKDSPFTATIDSEQVGNTKITSVALNEKRKDTKTSSNISSRAITQPEAIMLLCQIPQIATDIEFIHISTVSLEERPAFDHKPAIFRITREFPIHGPINTGADLDTSLVLPSQAARQSLAVHRHFSESSIVLAKDQLLSPLSIDSVTVFGLRPPELYWVREPRYYFRWFKSTAPVFVTKEDRENPQAAIHRYCSVQIQPRIADSMWIDARSCVVKIRYYALSEAVLYLNSSPLSWFRNNNRFRNEMLALFTKLKKFVDEEQSATGIRSRHVETWTDLKTRFICCEESHFKNLPVVWISAVKPTSPNRFLIHLLLSLGQFINEMDLLESGSILQAFILANLINPTALNESINNIMHSYVTLQLIHMPGSSRQFDRFISCAYDCLVSVFVQNTMFADGTPPYLYTKLTRSIDDKQQHIIRGMLERSVFATYNHLSSVKFAHLPLPSDVMQFLLYHTPIMSPWTALTTPLTNQQSPSSYAEQRGAVIQGQNLIRQYMTVHDQCPKSMLIVGDPGAGKTTVALTILYHAMTNGLKCYITAMMSERAQELGGTHIHSLLSIPVRDGWSPSRLAEYAISKMLSHSCSFLEFLRQLDVLMFDEFGQIPCELISTIDIIFRTIRRCTRFMGGVLVIATMDIFQLLPVKGRPPMLSSHMLTSFLFSRLQNSVRSAGDGAFCEIQKISRMLPSELTTDVCDRFRQLIKATCSFVPSFDDRRIPVNATYVFGKKAPGIQIQNTILTNKKRHYQYRMSVASDEEMLYEGAWKDASSYTTTLLDRKCKEPHELFFFEKSLYLVTYNCPNKQFSQSQLAILMELPSDEHLLEGKPIKLYVSPPGKKEIPPPNVTIAQLVAKQWCLINVGHAPRNIVRLRSQVKARRKQYGLRLYLTATIHSCMGHTLSALVTKVSLEDPLFLIWERAQVVVLLSRTTTGANTIFVGNPDDTIDALLHALKQTTQYQQYMERLLLNLISSPHPLVPTVDQSSLPFRPMDMVLPDDTSGVVYMIVSSKVQNVTYIGQCTNLSRRLDEHNSKSGSNQTASDTYKPWYLLAYVTGFGSNRNKLRAFESQWKQAREREKHRLTTTGIADLAKMVISERLSDDPTEVLRYITGLTP